MVSSYKKLDEALQDLVEAYIELEDQITEKVGDDEDAFTHSIIEALETSIEAAIEEHDFSTTGVAAILSNLTEALEQLDPVAFDDDEDEDSDEEYEISDEYEDLDEDEELDLDEAELDEDEDEDDY